MERNRKITRREKPVSKEKYIVERAEKLNIPVFAFTAEELMSVESIRHFLQMCKSLGHSNDQIYSLEKKIKKFSNWQVKNKSKIHRHR